MRKILIPIIISFLTFNLLPAQDAASEKAVDKSAAPLTPDTPPPLWFDSWLTFGVNYMYYQKELLREGYDMALPWLGLDAGLIFSLDEELMAEVEIGFRNRIMSYYEGMNNEVGLMHFQALALGRYYFFKDRPPQIYGRVGIGLHFALINTHLLRVAENGDITGKMSVKQLNIGIGALIGLGWELRVNGSSALDVNLNYELTSLGDTDLGGLGDIGGLKFGVKYKIAL